MKKSILLLAAGLGTLCLSASQAETVVIVHPSAATPTKEQIADVYVGKSQSLTPIDQPESAPIRAEFYMKVTGRDLRQVKATWSRLIFSGKVQPPKEVADAAAVKKAVAADPTAIGYIDKAAADSSVKIAFSVE